MISSRAITLHLTSAKLLAKFNFIQADNQNKQFLDKFIFNKQINNKFHKLMHYVIMTNYLHKIKSR